MPYSAVVIYERIVEKGFDGKITISKDYLKPLRPVTMKEGPAVRRYETNAGSQVQMDWGICKYLDPCNRIRKAACFVMILEFSRVRYVEFCKRCDLGSFQRCCKSGQLLSHLSNKTVGSRSLISTAAQSRNSTQALTASTQKRSDEL